MKVVNMKEQMCNVSRETAILKGTKMQKHRRPLIGTSLHWTQSIKDLKNRAIETLPTEMQRDKELTKKQN